MWVGRIAEVHHLLEIRVQVDVHADPAEQGGRTGARREHRDVGIDEPAVREGDPDAGRPGVDVDDVVPEQRCATTLLEQQQLGA